MKDLVAKTRYTDEQLAELLRDENGLPPKGEAVEVLQVVLAAIDRVNERDTSDHSVGAYGDHIIASLTYAFGECFDHWCGGSL